MIIYDSTNAHYDKYISRFEKMLRTVKITEAKFDGIECQSIPHIGVSTSDDISKNPPNVIPPEASESKETDNLPTDSTLETVL